MAAYHICRPAGAFFSSAEVSFSAQPFSKLYQGACGYPGCELLHRGNWVVSLFQYENSDTTEVEVESDAAPAMERDKSTAAYNGVGGITSIKQSKVLYSN